MSDRNAPSAQDLLNQSTDLPRSPIRMWLAGWMVVSVFVLSNTATPLYVLWQGQLGFASSTLTLIFAAYILGLLLSLLIAGQVSDRYGRSVVLLPGLVCAMSAALLFRSAESVEGLLFARLLTGIAVGIIVSAGMASVVDQGGVQRRRLSSLVASMSMVLGAGLGPLLAGSLATFASRPIEKVFTLELGILALAFLIAWTMPNGANDTQRRGGARWRLPSVERHHRLHILLGVALFGPGITATSFVLSLGPSLLASLLHIKTPLMAGATAFLMFISAFAVQIVLRRRTVEHIFYFSAAATFASMLGISTAIAISSPAVLIIAALLAGAGQGLGQLGGLTLIALRVSDNKRAQANALLNMGGYVPAGLLPVATGFLIDRTNLAVGAYTLAGLLASCALLAAWFVARNKEEVHYY
ncbi:MFS transporter [Pseudomonas sp. NPDC087614]|uniref:MFS transporter n=1 Tax=Pseudomonas sp. NPDC087614 TaxID=3364442 RepID=UPI0038176B45